MFGNCYKFDVRWIIKKYVFQSWMKDFPEHSKDLQKSILLIYNGHCSHVILCYRNCKREWCNQSMLNSKYNPRIITFDIGVFIRLNKKKIEGNFKAVILGGQTIKRLKSSFPTLLKQLNNQFSPQNAVKGF